MAYAEDGLVVLVTEDDEVMVAEMADFEKELWTADLPDDYRSYYLTDQAGTLWVATEDGYAEAKTGELVGFGDDLDDDETGYMLTTGGVLLRYEAGSSSSTASAMAVDPKTGDDLWDDEVTKLSGYLVQQGDLLVAPINGNKVVAYKASNGEEQWSVRVSGVESVEALPNGNLAAVSDYSGGTGTVTLLKSKDGSELAEANDVAMSQWATGNKVGYGVADGKVQGYDLTGDSSKRLWSLNLKLGSSDSAYLSASGGHLWVRVQEYDSDSGYVSVSTLYEVVKG
jgi:outer membrane protein assembly factor BamB